MIETYDYEFDSLEEDENDKMKTIQPIAPIEIQPIKKRNPRPKLTEELLISNFKLFNDFESLTDKHKLENAINFFFCLHFFILTEFFFICSE